MRFKKDINGRIQCECGCHTFWDLENMDIFNDRLMSEYCIEQLAEKMYQDTKDGGFYEN